MIELTRAPIVRIAGSCLSVWAIPAAVVYGVWTETMTYLLALGVGGAVTAGWNGLGALRGSRAGSAERRALVGGSAFGLAVAVAAWMVQARQPRLGMSPTDAGQCAALTLLAAPLAVYLAREWRSRSCGAARALAGLAVLGTLLLVVACEGWGLRFAYCGTSASGALVGTTLTLLACRCFPGGAGTRITRQGGLLLSVAYGAMSLSLILLGQISSRERWLIALAGVAFAFAGRMKADSPGWPTCIPIRQRNRRGFSGATN